MARPEPLTPEDVRREVDRGQLDTVAVSITDMQGRLQGKRIHGQFFIDHVLENGTEGCNYLLAVDVDMNTVDGYAMASWDQGYGDFVMVPDLTTLRRTPWLPGTALVLCDVLDHHSHEDVPHSPRAILKKQLKRLEAMKMKAYMASELEFFLFDESYESIHEKGYRGLKTAGYYIEDYHILQTSKEEVYMRALRNGLQQRGDRRHAGREQQRGGPALQRRDGLFRLPQRRIAVADVVLLQLRPVALVAGIGGGEIDRRHHGARLLVHRAQCMRRDGLRPQGLVRHAARR